MGIKRQESLIGTVADWAASNTVLKRGQVAVVNSLTPVLRIGDGVSAFGALKRPESQRAYTSPGVGEGWDDLVDLDYDTNDPAQPEHFMRRTRDSGGVLRRTLWMNESLLLRINTVRKAEPALKLHSLGVSVAGAVIEVRDNWNQGAVRRWGVNGKGQQLLGPNETVAGVVVTLAAGAALPTGLPDGTIIARTA